MARTIAEVRAFLDSLIGLVTVDKSDSSLNGQCVSLIKNVLEFVGAPNPYGARGHAKDIPATYVTQGIARTGNGTLNVAVNRYGGGGFGHVWIKIGSDTWQANMNGKPVKKNTYEDPITDIINLDQWITGGSTGTGDDLKAFLTSKVNSNFGLSIDQVVNFIYNDPRTNRFGVWCGNDKGKIKAVLNAVSSAGMSYAWFAAYEIQEGYNPSWGWLNHTVIRGDYLTDASLTSKDIINSCNNKSHGIAWDDPGGGTVGMVPQSVRSKGQSDFNSWPLGTIGVGYAQSTAAAAWAIWYPAGLSGSVNGVQDYGNPIQGCVDVIKQMGGKLSQINPEPNKGEEDEMIKFKVIEGGAIGTKGYLYNGRFIVGGATGDSNVIYHKLTLMESTGKITPIYDDISTGEYQVLCSLFPSHKNNK